MLNKYLFRVNDCSGNWQNKTYSGVSLSNNNDSVWPKEKQTKRSLHWVLTFGTVICRHISTDFCSQMVTDSRQLTVVSTATITITTFITTITTIAVNSTNDFYKTFLVIDCSTHPIINIRMVSIRAVLMWLEPQWHTIATLRHVGR